MKYVSFWFTFKYVPLLIHTSFDRFYSVLSIETSWNVICIIYSYIASHILVGLNVIESFTPIFIFTHTCQGWKMHHSKDLTMSNQMRSNLIYYVLPFQVEHSKKSASKCHIENSSVWLIFRYVPNDIWTPFRRLRWAESNYV